MNLFHRPTAKSPVDALGESMDRSRVAVAEALLKLGPLIDADPKGLDAVVLAATLRAYADVIEMRFQEGNAIGPLKTLVDEVRSRIVQALQGG